MGKFFTRKIAALKDSYATIRLEEVAAIRSRWEMDYSKAKPEVEYCEVLLKNGQKITVDNTQDEIRALLDGSE